MLNDDKKLLLDRDRVFPFFFAAAGRCCCFVDKSAKRNGFRFGGKDKKNTRDEILKKVEGV